MTPCQPTAQAGGRRLLEGKQAKEGAAKKAAQQKAVQQLAAGQKMYMIVGFEVVACSIRREPGKPINKNLMCPQSLDDPNAPTAQEVKKGARRACACGVHLQGLRGMQCARRAAGQRRSGQCWAVP